MLSNWHMIGPDRSMYARVRPTALLLWGKREKRPGDGRGDRKLRGDEFCSTQLEKNEPNVNPVTGHV